jgi:hypothetical protein
MDPRRTQQATEGPANAFVIINNCDICSHKAAYWVR